RFPGAIPELGADCSRVTHPFAARVPRRAFPLDLHVLSTPPAFVLSQDQTLQQKPWKIQNPAIKEIAREKNYFLALAYKHPVEFSRNKRPRPRTPAQGPSVVAVSPQYPCPLCAVKSGSSRCDRRRRCPQHTQGPGRKIGPAQVYQGESADRPTHGSVRLLPVLTAYSPSTDEGRVPARKLFAAR